MMMILTSVTLLFAIWVFNLFNSEYKVINALYIPKSRVPILLHELRNSLDNTDVEGNFRFSAPQMQYQQRLIWEETQAEPLFSPEFHESVDSETLLQDYRLTADRNFMLMHMHLLSRKTSWYMKIIKTILYRMLRAIENLIDFVEEQE